jgi:serine/threonine protein kinase
MDPKVTPNSPSPSSKYFSLLVNSPNHQDFKVLNQIDAGKFMLFTVSKGNENKKYALKVFPYKLGTISNQYKNEKRFMNIQHPNVIQILESKDEHLFLNGMMRVRSSYLLMELAPYKDFHELLVEKRLDLDEMLMRTYFHQLIEGLEYLHSKQIYHMDIKIENLLLSQDYKLKIADFDMSYIKGHGEINSRGTTNFRAPEVAKGRCIDPEKSDVFSAGLVLFIMKSKGYIAFSEEKIQGMADYYLLLKEQKGDFWIEHSILQKKRPDYFEDDFKELFFGMTKIEPSKRWGIGDIKSSKWYNGPIYSQEEVETLMVTKL